MKRSHLLAGIVAPMVALSGIGASIVINRSWWRLTDNAISDLGRLGLPYNWVLNVSLMLSAALAIYYSLGLLRLARNRVEKVGYSLILLGFVFLALIGLFPEGTGPHYYVSWGFFIFASLGILVSGLAGDKKWTFFSLALLLTTWGLALWAMKHFPGIAPAEFIGVGGIVLWHYVLIYRLRGALHPRD